MTDFPKGYDPKQTEEHWYDEWVAKGYFKPEVHGTDGETFSIVIPPPNVTGSLHMGHALNATLQDALTRWHRMRGIRALWLPGTDHAGIATQNVVERQLSAEDTDRHSLGREKFIERVWEWKHEYGGRIIHQLKKLGSSCDWSRERFTMDEGLSRAVREVFVRLFEEGLIYRDSRLINWCPRCHTALSDLEVEHEDLDGTLTYMKYPLLDGTGHITVATTRPETMLGDTAVAVNTSDERYQAFIGKTIELPLLGRKIPVVADDAVDPEFGTGAVKITPAHDFNDEAVAKRQSPPLPAVNVINEDGTMSEEAGARYAGLDRYEARSRVVEDLEQEGLIEKVEKHSHSVGHCYRCKTVIEPYSTPQWYVKIQPLAEPAIEAVRNGSIRIVPEGWKNSYYSWMENIQDWCITRQIWWGHRVPVWYCQDCGETVVSREDPTECTKCQSANLEQDTDVLDTWFSSALWPFSTMGWPDEAPDVKDFYPTSVLVTAFDILFFWVARMIMMGLKFMGDVPFKDVYIHALVRDSHGQKMSKSKGNVIDPLLLIDQYGADAFRFTLAAFAAQGRDVKFDEQRVQGYRFFINKLWNATRFIFMNLGEGYRAPKHEDLKRKLEENAQRLPLGARWILSRLGHAVEEMNRGLEGYYFNDAASAVYQFTWHEFCDWYIEMAKTEMDDDTRDTLVYVLDTVLRLLHPFMPFVTEEIWRKLPMEHECESIVIAPFPQDLTRDEAAEAEMAFVMDAVTGVRNIRGELNLPPAETLETIIKTETTEATEALKKNINYLEKLAKAQAAEIGPEAAKPGQSYTSVKNQMEVYVKLKGLDVEGELKRLNKEKAKIEQSIGQLSKKLANEDFISRAPAHVVEKEKQKFAEFDERLKKVEESIEKIQSLAD